jgi:hypothetical protein
LVVLRQESGGRLMKQNIKDAFKAFSLELPLYAVLVAIYGFLVLHFLGGWLFQLFTAERKLYAVTALGLIVGQGLCLEILARALLGLIKGKREK